MDPPPTENNRYWQWIPLRLKTTGIGNGSPPTENNSHWQCIALRVKTTTLGLASILIPLRLKTSGIGNGSPSDSKHQAMAMDPPPTENNKTGPSFDIDPPPTENNRTSLASILISLGLKTSGNGNGSPSGD
jgi:hypothetical protein